MSVPSRKEAMSAPEQRPGAVPLIGLVFAVLAPGANEAGQAAA